MPLPAQVFLHFLIRLNEKPHLANTHFHNPTERHRNRDPLPNRRAQRRLRRDQTRLRRHKLERHFLRHYPLPRQQRRVRRGSHRRHLEDDWDVSGGVLGRGIGSGSECESGCVLLGGRKCCNRGINDFEYNPIVCLWLFYRERTISTFSLLTASAFTYTKIHNRHINLIPTHPTQSRSIPLTSTLLIPNPSPFLPARAYHIPAPDTFPHQALTLYILRRASDPRRYHTE